MPEKSDLPPEKRLQRAFRIILLYIVIIGAEVVGYVICALFLPKEAWRTVMAAGILMFVADICIVFVGRSINRSYTDSRDTMARHGAQRISSLLDILKLESETLRFLGENLSARFVERGYGAEAAEALEAIKEIEDLISNTKSRLNGDKGRQEAFYASLAEAEVRFGVLFPKLSTVSKQAIGMILQAMDEFRQSRESMYRYMFFLSETGAILSKMSGESNRYATSKMEKILAGFKEMVGYSVTIGNDNSKIMRDVMDAGGKASLGAVARESGAISADLGKFFGDMDSLRGFSDEIISANAKQLANIRKMAEGIEDFSETIRLISMNVNIEAARLSSSSSGADARNSGKGFQVLAKNMSDFALKAQDLARDERRTIDEAENALTGVNARFVHRLDELIALIPAVRARLDPFEGIIKSSFENLENVLRSVGGLSGAVDQRLKAIIGQLQFQDLTRQELEHIIEFLSAGLSLQSEFGAQSFALKKLPEDEEKDLRRRAIRIYRDLATTINETRVIEAYSSERGIALDEDEIGSPAKDGSPADEKLTDGSIRLF